MDKSTKRHHEDANANNTNQNKRQKRGFQVGPANLPDGTYRRKAQKIKQGLIDKAKLRKEYAKAKQQYDEEQKQQGSAGNVNPGFAVEGESGQNVHPDRQVLLEQHSHAQDQQAPHSDDDDEDSREPGEDKATAKVRSARARQRSRPMPYQKEMKVAQKQKEEAEQRRATREEAQRQREANRLERERFRSAMAKARRPGKDGKRRLGRESKVLLERVQKMMAD